MIGLVAGWLRQVRRRCEGAATLGYGASIVSLLTCSVSLD